MTLKNGNGKYISWEFISITLITIVLGMLGYFLADVQGQVRTKVNQTQYDCDMTKIDKKLDMIINMHIDDK
jgi:hypothetical protein